MQGVAEASLLVERSKVDLQERSFDRHMAYLERRDQRLNENAAVVNENARLVVAKQGEMVSCLAQLTHVLVETIQKPLSENVEKAVPACTPSKTVINPVDHNKDPATNTSLPVGNEENPL